MPAPTNDRQAPRGFPRCAGMQAALAVAVLAGCHHPKPLALDLPPPNAPTRQQLISAHNERVARLATTYSQGVIEIRWTDDRGRHFEQGDLEFWQTSDNRTALRISKVGEDLAWLGSSKDEYWLFDLMTKGDHVLYRGRHDQPLQRFGALGVKPLALLDLLGLTAIGPGRGATSVETPPTFDKAQGAWVIESAGRGGIMRISFDQGTLLPKHIEELDAAGSPVAESDLSRYETVETPGVAVMAQPKMAEVIDIRRGNMPPDGASAKAGEINGHVKIAINQTVGTIEPRVLKGAFDIDRLTQALRPDRVDDARSGPTTKP